MPSSHWPRYESHRVRADGIPTHVNGIIKIRKSHACRRLVEPIPQRIDEQSPSLGRACSGSPHTLVGFGVGVSTVQWNDEYLADGRVVVCLDVIESGGDEVQMDENVGVGGLEQTVG